MKQIIDTVKKELNKCDCSAPILNESLQHKMPISEAMRYHLDKQIPIYENVFRPGSKAHIELLNETRLLYKQGVIELQGTDKFLFEKTDLGRFGMFRGEVVPLDLPLMEIETLTEAEKKQPALGKPKRGGSKKFYVYVKDPKTKRIKKVSFGMAGGGLRAKLNNPKARQAFAKRHTCANKKDRTKASYWSCRLPRYAKLLGFKTTFSGFW